VMSAMSASTMSTSMRVIARRHTPARARRRARGSDVAGRVRGLGDAMGVLRWGVFSRRRYCCVPMSASGMRMSSFVFSFLSGPSDIT
jgi:hypothetical protein